MAISPKDYETVSNAVLDGDMEMSSLPKEVQDLLAERWAAGGNGDPRQQPNAAGIEELVRGRQEQRSSGVGGMPTIFKPIEAIGSGLYWVWSQTVSPAISAAAIGLRRPFYGREEGSTFDNDFWGTKELADLWGKGHNTSPAQSIWMLGLNNKELSERGIGVDQIAIDKDQFKKGLYRDEPSEKDPYGTIPAYDEYFGTGAAKFATGSVDFALSWYADPFVLAGKAGGAAKTKGFTKPVAKELEKTGGANPTEAFNKFSEGSTFQGIVNTVEEIKTANPNNAAYVLRRDLPTLAKSADGDYMAKLLVQAKDTDEVSDVLRVSMGDEGARLALKAKSSVIDLELDQLTARQVALGTSLGSMSAARQASPFGQRLAVVMDQQEKAIARLDADHKFITDRMNAFGLIENMNYNRFTTPLGLKVKGSEAVREGGQFKSVRGEGFIQGTANLVYNSAIGFPIKLVRSYGDIKPSHFIDVHGENSYRELEAAVAEFKGLDRATREEMVSRYIKADPNERQRVLVSIENDVTAKMIDNYNLKNPGNEIDKSIADGLYKDFLERRQGAQAAAGKRQTYGSATIADPSNPGLTIRVAEIDAGGGRMVTSPIFDTQLANNHVMMDFRTMERAINMHGAKFEEARKMLGNGWYRTTAMADQLSTVWKFAQLARLGYAPRALADDFLGQVARFGGMAMLARAGEGGKVMVQDFTRGRWMKNGTAQTRQQAGILEQNITEKSAQQASLQAEIARVRAGKQPGDIIKLEDDLTDINRAIASDRMDHAGLVKAAALGSQMRDVQVGREIFSGSLAGKQGEMYRDFTAGQRNFANMMGSSSDWYLKKMRAMNWENISPASAGADKHMDAWFRHINDQIAQSGIGREALKGADEGQMVKWMRTTAEGRQYRKDIGLKNITDMELAQRVKAQVDYVLPPAYLSEARQAALQGKLDRAMLESLDEANRPMINAEMFSYAEGRSPISKLLDGAITGYYNLANQLPATHLLRHPLFGQQYKASLTSQMARLRSQGITHVDEGLRKTMEASARKAALKDVKDFTFTMDHETKMAHAMKHFGAFFGAQQESWNRWARIISEKPQALAHVAQVYGAPARAGLVVDQNGNTLDAAGYITDPSTGEKVLTKYSDRKILIQIPEYLGGKKLNKAMGLDENASFTVPMSSLELVLNHGDGGLPVGAGPFVQLAANDIPWSSTDARGNPALADIYKTMGILPFGPQEDWTDFINPTTGKRLGDATDDMGEIKQRALFNMMQVENWKYENGQRETEPTWNELMDRADKWTAWRVGIAWALPFSMNAQDPYQFFRDEHARMQKLDPNSADEKFYEKYGDSFFTFSQSLSKNNTGLKPTVDSVRMSQYYQDLIDKVGPEYAGLIVGDEGDGEFSQGAYYYQKTHGLAAGDTNTQRQTLSAREGWEKAQKAKGWQLYNKMMNRANADLFDGGFDSYSSNGAENLKLYKQAITKMLTQETFADGTKNGFYNEAWKRDFESFDKGKYDATAKALNQIVSDPELQSKMQNPDGTVGMRSDLYTLMTYLQYRKQLQGALKVRKAGGGSDNIVAQDNEDLKDSWDRTVMTLLEADTKFAWIHNRWFSGDMGFNINTEVAPAQQGAFMNQQNTQAGQMGGNVNGAI